MNRPLVFAALLAAHSMAFGSFYDGNALNEWAESSNRITEHRQTEDDFSNTSSLHGYVVGVADTIKGVFVCYPVGTTAGQLIAIVKKYVKDHPEKWGDSASQIVIDALKVPFPCQAKRSTK